MAKKYTNSIIGNPLGVVDKLNRESNDLGNDDGSAEPGNGKSSQLKEWLEALEETRPRIQRWPHHALDHELVCARGKCNCMQYVFEFVLPRIDPGVLDNYVKFVKWASSDPEVTRPRVFDFCEIKQIVQLWSLGCDRLTVQRLVGIPDAIISDDGIHNEYRGFRAAFYNELKSLGKEILKYSLASKLTDIAANRGNAAALIFLAKAVLGLSDAPANQVHLELTKTITPEQLESELEKELAKLGKKIVKSLPEGMVEPLDTQSRGREPQVIDVDQGPRLSQSTENDEEA